MFLNVKLKVNEYYYYFAGKLDDYEFESIDKESMGKFFDKHRADFKAASFDNVFTQQTWIWHDEDELLAYEDLFDDYHERYPL